MSRRRAQPLELPPSITLEHELELDAVKVTVVVPAGDDRLTVLRTGPSGTPAIVRGAGELVVTAGSTVIVRDYEAPLGVPLTYTATSWPIATPASTESASDTITVPSSSADNPWLVDLAKPTNTLRVILESLAELEYRQASGVHEVLNRRSPIVTGDLARTPTFDLVFVTLELAERERARAALGNGTPLLVRTPPEHGVGNLYLFPSSGWSEQRVSRLALETVRRFTVRAQQVERPDPTLYVPTAPTTYAAVAAAFADYAALAAARSSYDALAYDYAAGEPTSTVPWPPDDV